MIRSFYLYLHNTFTTWTGAVAVAFWIFEVNSFPFKAIFALYLAMLAFFGYMSFYDVFAPNILYFMCRYLGHITPNLKPLKRLHDARLKAMGVIQEPISFICPRCHHTCEA